MVKQSYIKQGCHLSIFKNPENFYLYDLSCHRRDKWNWVFFGRKGGGAVF